LYSSAQVGIFGSIVRKTNVDRILQLDCRATDFYQEDAFPTYLYYNPYDTLKSVCFYNAEKTNVDLYDALSHEYLTKALNDEGCFAIEAKSARLIVVLPSGSEITMENGNYVADGKVVAYAQNENQK
ncbi:MAG TPA: hypothetical protein VF490_18670, partial [Chryseosolibacter sp.]